MRSLTFAGLLALVTCVVAGCGKRDEELEAERTALREERAQLEAERAQLETERRSMLDDRKRVEAERAAREQQQRSGIKLDLPSTGAIDIDPAKPALVVEVTSDGSVYVGGKPLRDADIENVFRAAYTRDKQTQVVVKADQGVSHGRIVQLMEQAKRAGLTRLAIGTQSP